MEDLEQMAWTGQGGAHYDMNDLEADRLFVLYNWKIGGRNLHNYLVYLRASIFCVNEFGENVTTNF